MGQDNGCNTAQLPVTFTGFKLAYRTVAVILLLNQLYLKKIKVYDLPNDDLEMIKANFFKNHACSYHRIPR